MNNISLLIRFHLHILPSILKVILITIFTNQPNCVIEVGKKKKIKPKVSSWFLEWIFLATKEEDRWLHFLLLLYFLWFHFSFSCNPTIHHKWHKIKLSDMRYSHKRSGAPILAAVLARSLFSIQVMKMNWGAMGRPSCPQRLGVWRVFHSVFWFQVQRLSTHSSEGGSICPRPWGTFVECSVRGKDEKMVGRKQALTS